MAAAAAPPSSSSSVSALMHPAVAAMAEEDVQDAALDEYFAACHTTSPSSSSSSGSSNRSGRPSRPASATAVRAPETASPPLQGSAARPLRHRPRPTTAPLHVEPLISFPATLDEEADAAPSPPRRRAAPPPQASAPRASPLAASTPAVASLEGLARGVAGQALAERLQLTALPYAPAHVSHLQSGTSPSSAAAASGAAFEFHVPPPSQHTTTTASTSAAAAARGTRHTSPSAGTAAAAAPTGATTTSTTIRTRGRSGGRRSAGAPSTAMPPARVAARQRAVLFDVLCAVRQHPTASCVLDAASMWRLHDAVAGEAQAEGWPSSIMGAFGQLLEVANDVAAVEAHERAFHQRRRPDGDSDDAEAERGVQEASLALEAAAAQSLSRLCAVFRLLVADLVRWVLQLQECLLATCARAATSADSSHAAPSTLPSPPVLLPLPKSCALADLVAAVRENALPLQRCRALVEESACLDGLAESSAASGGSTGPETCTSLAARLLDTLIIQASAFQDTSTMDLYRFYVMLLLYTAWPYVLLCTAAIFGFVRGIDPPVWRRQLPRLFRSSFSHVRIGDATRRYPTDVLSLLLNCVGYYSGEGTGGVEVEAGREASLSAVARDGSVGGDGLPVPATSAAAAAWVSVPRRTAAGGRKSSTSEPQVARAALASARSFVLRSLASFTRRHKQIALSRTPMHGQGTAGAAAAATAAATSATAPALTQQWHRKSVKDILHYILYSGSTAGGAGDSTDDVVRYARQNQDVQRRVVPATAASDRGHFAYFPTTIPLGFTAMQAEGLAGQQRLQQQQQHQRGEEALQRPSGGAVAFSGRTADARHRSQRLDDDEGDDGGGGGAGAQDTDLLRRRGLSLWTLVIADSATAPDVRFTNALGQSEERLLEADADELEGGDGAAGTRSGSPHRRRRQHQLWINVTIPCARWVTTALLIPIGVAVQRLQERRLKELFAMALQAVDSASGVGLLESLGDAPPPAASDAKASAEGAGGAARVASLVAPVPVTGGAAACSFLHALKLIVDVALCRDQERLVRGFVERLYNEPRWWVRRGGDGGATAFVRLGTAAPTVSLLFSDALRGKRFGELARLAVLPARQASAAPAAGAPGEAGEEDHGRGSVDAASPSAADLLDAFASFQLHFTLPDAFERVLLPRDLSVYVAPTTGTTERSYQTYFWERRRRCYVEEGAGSGGVGASGLPASSIPPTASAGSAGRAPLVTPGVGGIAFADVWSYVFGYQCALCYAQVTLREHKKRLQRRDAVDSEVVHAMGDAGVWGVQRLQYASRGLGSAYYTLTFAVDALLTFTQSTAIRVVYELERLLAKAMRASAELHSCMELCYQLDALLLELGAVAFSARPPVALNARERAMQSSAGEAVRAAVQSILEVAVDPARLPVSQVSRRTRNGVEALVAAVSGAAEQQPVSSLAAHLQPLLVRLTFNHYYGTDEDILSFRFRPHMSLPELTPEELAYYASLNLADPDADALAAFLTESQANTDGAADSADRHADHSEATASRFNSCPTPPDGSTTSEAAALSFARPATSSTAAALARRRLSGSPLRAAPSAAAATGAPRATRYGVTQLLDSDGLVGGVAGMADAALQTRCVELPGRHLTTTLPIQCFLNVTHVYLQHNALADLDGMELLSQLQVLVAHHNQLTSLTPLKELERVVYVDASFNRLTEPVARLLRDALPCATLQSLDLRHNPFLDAADAARQQAYRSEVCAACPALEHLDGDDVDSSDTDTDASGDSEAGSSGRASAVQEVAARGRDSLRSRRVLGAIATARAAAASTPAPLQSPQQPHGGDASSSGSDAEVRLDPGADAAAAAEVVVVVAPRPHTAAAYRAAALLEEEQTRLVHQLRARHTQASSKATAEVAAVSTTRASSASVSESGDTDPAVLSAAELLPVLESEPTDVVSVATHADALLLYQNLQYTQAVGQARLQRDVAAHWDDVARVLQTAQALHQDRRRRLQQRLQAATPAYAESLRLLQQESYVPDLAGYRSGKLVAAARARDGKHAAAAPPPAPTAGPDAASQVPPAGPAPAVSRNRPTPETRCRPPAPPAAPAATAARTPPPARSPAPTAVAPASAPPRRVAKQRATAAKLAPRPPPQPRRT